MRENIICSLCYDELLWTVDEKEQLKPYVVLSGCGHAFHQHCITTAHLSSINSGSLPTCPLCSKPHTKAHPTTRIPIYDRLYLSSNEDHSQPSYCADQHPAELCKKASSAYRLAEEITLVGGKLTKKAEKFVRQLEKGKKVEKEELKSMEEKMGLKVVQLLEVLQVSKAKGFLENRPDALVTEIQTLSRAITEGIRALTLHQKRLITHESYEPQIKQLSAQLESANDQHRLDASIWKNKTESQAMFIKELERDIVEKQVERINAQRDTTLAHLSIQSLNNEKKVMERKGVEDGRKIRLLEEENTELKLTLEGMRERSDSRYNVISGRNYFRVNGQTFDEFVAMFSGRGSGQNGNVQEGTWGNEVRKRMEAEYLGGLVKKVKKDGGFVAEGKGKATALPCPVIDPEATPAVNPSTESAYSIVERRIEQLVAEQLAANRETARQAGPQANIEEGDWSAGPPEPRQVLPVAQNGMEVAPVEVEVGVEEEEDWLKGPDDV